MRTIICQFCNQKITKEQIQNFQIVSVSENDVLLLLHQKCYPKYKRLQRILANAPIDKEYWKEYKKRHSIFNKLKNKLWIKVFIWFKARKIN